MKIFPTTKRILTGIAAICIAVYFICAHLFPPLIHPNISDVLQENEEYSGAAIFAAYHHAIRTHDGRPSPEYEANYRVKAFKKAQDALRSRVQLREPLDWIERGPANVGGRTRGLLIDPDDPTYRTWYVGSVGGGVWKTDDAGLNWRHLTEGLPSLAASHLAMSPSNPNVIYLGTGEGYSRLGINGSGMWRSEDRGERWEQLESTANDALRFGNITRVIVNPANEQEVLVCSRSSKYFDAGEAPEGYILKSTDGGRTWKERYSSSRAIQHILPDPQDFQTIYAAVDSVAVLRSMDAGDTWEVLLDTRRFKVGRMELAVAPTNSDYLYISAESELNNFELYRSTDRGLTWHQVIGVDEENEFGPVFGAGQGWFDNTIAVHPYKEDEVFVGGAGPILQIFTTDDIARIQIEEIENATSFLDLIPFPGSTAGVQLPEDLKLSTGVTPEDYVDVELRFGPGKKQLFHRFFAEATDISGVYRDYIELPFEVWDVTNDRQLMAGFTDANDDGQWSLSEVRGSSTPAEAILIYPIDYNAEAPSDNVVEQMHYRTFMAFFAGKQDGRPLDLTTVEASAITIEFERLLGALILPITDGYRNYPSYGISSKGVHVDHHNLQLIPVAPNSGQFYILNANDGGVAFSRDGGQTFIQTGSSFDIGLGNILTGYNTAQFYGVDKMNGADRYIGGTQDNGSWTSGIDPSASSEWQKTAGADGFQAAWHYGDTSKLMETAQFNTLRRSLNGGRSWQLIRLPGSGPFLTRLASSKQDPDLLFAVSKQGILRSTDFGDNWDVIEMENRWVPSIFGPPIKISLATPSVIWTGNGISEDSRIFVSKNGGDSFTAAAVYPHAEMGRLTGIATHPFDVRTAYALFSHADGPKILKTSDFGASWHDLSGFVENRAESQNGFPDVATYSLLVMPFDTNQIWVGTEIGLFESLDGGANWHYADDGLPATAIWEMKIVNDEVVVATHGRGIWTVSLPQLQGYEPPEALLAPSLVLDAEGFDGRISGKFALNALYDSVKVSVALQREDGSITRSDFLSMPANTALLEAPFVANLLDLPEDTVLVAGVTVTGFKNGAELIDSVNTLVYSVTKEFVSDYADDFEAENLDWARLGFHIFQETSFDSRALHSLHPFPPEATLMSILRRPIIVDPAQSIVSFDEVVLGKPTKSGEIEVIVPPDFAVIEATTDRGASWIPIKKYDSCVDEDWMEAFENGSPGSAELIARQQFDLMDYFAEGDTIYLRFRMETEDYLESWGWMIDNVMVGALATNTSTKVDPESTWAVYPNPVGDQIFIDLELPKTGPVQLFLYDLSGKMVRQVTTLPNGGSGHHQQNFSMAGLPSATYLLVMRKGGEHLTKKIVKF